jgi:chitinase
MILSLTKQLANGNRAIWQITFVQLMGSVPSHTTAAATRAAPITLIFFITFSSLT